MAVRRRIYEVLESAGVAERRKKELTSDWTRLSSTNLIVLPEEEDLSADDALLKIRKAAERYVSEKIPAYSVALAGLGSK